MSTTEGLGAVGDEGVATPQPPILPTQAPAFSGFWRRFAALLVDVLLLVIIGQLLAWPFAGQFMTMNGWERLVGLVVVLAYAGVFDSRLCGGQSPGKRLLGIRVVGLDGGGLSVPRALLRKLVFWIPFALNGALTDPDLVLSAWGILAGLVIFGGFLSLAYLSVFNRPSRRVLHDLFTGSAVVRAKASEMPDIGRLKPVHRWALGVIFALLAIAPAGIQKLLPEGMLDELTDLQRAVAEQPGVTEAGVMVGISTGFSGGQSRGPVTYVSASLKVIDRQGWSRAQAESIARFIIDRYPAALEKDVISITFYRNYNLIIASGMEKMSYSLKVEYLREEPAAE